VPPPYKYEGPRADGAPLEISVTIEPEEGAEEGAEKKVRTKTITLLGARQAKEGGKAVYPNGDGFEGGYHAGLRHGAAGSYTHAAMSKARWLSLRPAGSPEASCSARACLRPLKAPASLGGRAGLPHRACFLRYRYAAQPPPAEGEDPLPPDGKYEGAWKKGEKSGLGVMVYAKGGKYHGMWKAGKRDGQGSFFYTNGE